MFFAATSLAVADPSNHFICCVSASLRVCVGTMGRKQSGGQRLAVAYIQISQTLDRRHSRDGLKPCRSLSTSLSRDFRRCMPDCATVVLHQHSHAGRGG